MTGDAVSTTYNPTPSSLVACNDLIVASDWRVALEQAGMTSLNALFEMPGELLGKPGLDDWRQRLRVTLARDGAVETLYLKRFRRPPARALRAVRGSGTGASSVAGVEWEWMRRLASEAIPCPKPVALGQQLSNGREVRSAVLSAAVPGDALERQMLRLRQQNRPRLRGLLKPTADLVARLHQCGYIHRDLYLSHLFHDPDSPVEQSLHLIDLQRVFTPRWRKMRWKTKDLASLNYSTPSDAVSNTDRVRWLKHYLGVSKLDADAKRLLRGTAAKTRRIARHDRRRRARLGLEEGHR